MELPLELINKILMFREIHPTTKIIKILFRDIIQILNSIISLYKNKDCNKLFFVGRKNERKEQIITNIINLLFNAIEIPQFRIKKVKDYYEFINPPRKNILHDMMMLELNISLIQI